MANIYYDEYDYAKIKTVKQLANFILKLTALDGENSYGEILDAIDNVCRYIKKTKATKGGKK